MLWHYIITNMQFVIRTQAQAPVPTRARSDLRAGVYVPLSESAKAEELTDERKESAIAGLDDVLRELEGNGPFDIFGFGGCLMRYFSNFLFVCLVNATTSC